MQKAGKLSRKKLTKCSQLAARMTSGRAACSMVPACAKPPQTAFFLSSGAGNAVMPGAWLHRIAATTSPIVRSSLLVAARSALPGAHQAALAGERADLLVHLRSRD